MFQRLYDLGGRHFIVPNVGPIGCIPYQRDVNPLSGNDCVALPNQIAQSFNRQLKSLLIELTANLKGSMFLYADVYHIVADIIQNYPSFGNSSVLVSVFVSSNFINVYAFLALDNRVYVSFWCFGSFEVLPQDQEVI